MTMQGWVGGLLAGLAVSAFAADWAQFRGPAHDGVSTETGWFRTGVTARVVWSAEVGMGHAATSIKDGRLYTMGKRDDEDVVWCLDARTGKTIWNHAYRCPAGNYPGPRSTPTVDGDRVFTLSREGLLLCLDAKRGALLWRRDTRKEMGAKPPQWGFASSPLVMDGLVVVNVGASGLAVDRETGATKWDSGQDGASYASPVPMKVGDKQAVLVFGTEAITAVELASGRRIWAHPWKTDCNVNASDPLVLNGNVLITSGYGHGAALLSVTGAVPEVIWQNRKLVSHFGSPVLSGTHVYGIHGDAGEGDLRCLDLASGVVTWYNADIGFGSLMMADGKLIVIGEKGTLAVFADDAQECHELWSQKVMDGTCWTMPVLCDGLIYCRNDKGRLVCLDLSGKEATQ